MITLFPTMEEIKNFETPLTTGENNFLKKIEEYFGNNNDNRNLEVYVQPNINGFRPDIVIVERNTNIWIVEIKDYNYDAYTITEQGWRIKNSEIIVKFPFKQVCDYKKVFYNLLSPSLKERVIKDIKNYKLIKTVVYFNNINKEVDLKETEKEALKKKNNDLEYTCYLFENSNQDDYNICFLQTSNGITQNEYLEIRRYLQPLESSQRKNIAYTSEQQKVIKKNLADYEIGQKIYGGGGSGKTLVLAKKAVDFLEKTEWKKNILILTYNLTLINYIKDRISEIFPKGYKCNKDSITITNYHQLYKSAMINYNDIENIKDLENKKNNKIDYFKNITNKIKKFDAIFIDEAQDYKPIWFDILKQHFIKINGKFFIVADPKQNLYNNCSLDEYKMPVVPVPGKWDEKLIKGCRYSSNDIIILLNFWSKTFLNNKYNNEEIAKNFHQERQQEFHFGIDYYKINSSQIIKKLLNIYDDLKKQNIHPSKITFISNTQKFLYDFDYEIRNNLKEETKTTFLKKELKELAEKKRSEIKKSNDHDRVFKLNFRQNSSLIKISTIHSFKGLESQYIVLLISPVIDKSGEIIPFEWNEDKSKIILNQQKENEETEINLLELIYVGLSRAKEKLIIVNAIDIPEIDKFFNEHKNFFYNFEIIEKNSNDDIEEVAEDIECYSNEI